MFRTKSGVPAGTPLYPGSPLSVSLLAPPGSYESGIFSGYRQPGTPIAEGSPIGVPILAPGYNPPTYSSLYSSYRYPSQTSKRRKSRKH